MKQSALFIFAAVCVLVRPQVRAEEFKIGLLYPLTGPMAEIGQQRLMGTVIAVDLYNHSAGGKAPHIRTLLEDTQADSRLAISAFQKLTLKDQSKVVFTALSSVSMAVRPLAEQAHILVFANSTHPELVKGTSYILRNFVTVQGGSEQAAAFFENYNFRKIGLLYLEDEFGEAMRAAVEAKAPTAKYQVVASEPFGKNASDLRPQLLKLKTQNPDLVFFIALGTNLGLAYRQASELKLEAAVLGWFTCSQTSVFNSAKDYLNDTFSLDPYIDTSSRSYQIFSANFKAKYPDQPIEPNAIMAFDAVNILGEALRQGLTSPESIRAYIVKKRSFETTQGIVEFMADGDSRRPMTVQKIVVIKSWKNMQQKTKE